MSEDLQNVDQTNYNEKEKNIYNQITNILIDSFQIDLSSDTPGHVIRGIKEKMEGLVIGGDGKHIGLGNVLKYLSDILIEYKDKTIVSENMVLEAKDLNLLQQTVMLQRAKRKQIEETDQQITNLKREFSDLKISFDLKYSAIEDIWKEVSKDTEVDLSLKEVSKNAEAVLSLDDKTTNFFNLELDNLLQKMEESDKIIFVSETKEIIKEFEDADLVNAVNEDLLAVLKYQTLSEKTQRKIKMLVSKLEHTSDYIEALMKQQNLLPETLESNLSAKKKITDEIVNHFRGKGEIINLLKTRDLFGKKGISLKNARGIVSKFL